MGSLLPNVKLILEKIGRPPALAVILVGEDAASHVYVRNKVKQTKDAGMVSIEHQLSAETSEKALLSIIDKLNKDDQIDGILVQLPLPKHINENSLMQEGLQLVRKDWFHALPLDAYCYCKTQLEIY